MSLPYSNAYSCLIPAVYILPVKKDGESHRLFVRFLILSDILVQDFVIAQIHADHLFFLSAYAYDKVDIICL